MKVKYKIPKNDDKNSSQSLASITTKNINKVLNFYRSHGINIIIIYTIGKYGNIILHRNHAYVNHMKFIRSNKNIIIFQVNKFYGGVQYSYYFLINELYSEKLRVYNEKWLFNFNEDYILEEIMNVYGKLMENEEIKHSHIPHISLYDLKVIGIPFTQILHSDNIVQNIVMVYGKKKYPFPIILSFFDMRFPVVSNQKYKWVLSLKEIEEFIEFINDNLKKNSITSKKEIKIKKLLMTSAEKFVGVEFTNNFRLIIDRIDIDKGDNIQKYEIKELNISKSPDSMGLRLKIQKIKKNNVKFEMYYIFLLHFAYHINIPDKPLHDTLLHLGAPQILSKIESFWKKYNFYDIFEEEREKLISGNIFNLEYIKIDKKKVYILLSEGNKEKLEAFLGKYCIREFIKLSTTPHKLTGVKYRKLCKKHDTGKYTITGQCDDNGMMIVDEKLFKIFTNLLASELMFNPFKRYTILGNKLNPISEYSVSDSDIYKKNIESSIHYTPFTELIK
jgi:hypothetical protein